MEDKEKMLDEMVDILVRNIETEWHNEIDFQKSAKNLIKNGFGDIKQFAIFIKEIMEKCKIEKELNEKAWWAQCELQYKILIEMDKKLNELFGD